MTPSRLIRLLQLALLALVLSGCEPAVTYEIPKQQWKDVVVRIESRPAPPAPGMNEFWVILNDTKGRPVSNAVVSVRASSPTWSQAIQDGHTGVYRRAIRVDNPAVMPLVVQLRIATEEAQLTFPLGASAE